MSIVVLAIATVSYTHLTLPTSDLVEISVVVVSLTKKTKQNLEGGQQIRTKIDLTEVRTSDRQDKTEDTTQTDN